MTRNAKLLAATFLALVPGAAWAQSAHIPWGLRDVGPRGTFNLCDAGVGPQFLLIPCWAPGHY